MPKRPFPSKKILHQKHLASIDICDIHSHSIGITVGPWHTGFAAEHDLQAQTGRGLRSDKNEGDCTSSVEVGSL